MIIRALHIIIMNYTIICQTIICLCLELNHFGSLKLKRKTSNGKYLLILSKRPFRKLKLLRPDFICLPDNHQQWTQTHTDQHTHTDTHTHTHTDSLVSHTQSVCVTGVGAVLVLVSTLIIQTVTGAWCDPLTSPGSAKLNITDFNT